MKTSRGRWRYRHSTRQYGRHAIWAAALTLAPAAGVLGAMGGTQPALASAASPSCAGGTCTVTYASPGTGQSFTIPAGVTRLALTLYGAMGGRSEAGDVAGGDGAQVTATLFRSAGQTLGIDVGGTPAPGGPPHSGGINGGGSAQDGGAGGGATDITSAGNRLVVAGGGGGAGIDGGSNSTCLGPIGLSPAGGTGGNAGTAGGTGADLEGGSFALFGGTGGGAGTASGPGRGGDGGGIQGADCPGALLAPGGPGFAGTGGQGGLAESGNGAGGGGYFGGASGGQYAFLQSTQGTFAQGTGGGGGGGSSLASGLGVAGGTVDDTGNSGQVNGGNGEAVISYANPVATGTASYLTMAQTLTVPAATGLLSATAGSTGPAGVTLTAAGPSSTDWGGTVTINADGSFSYAAAPGFAGSDTFGYTVTDPSGDYATGTVTIAVDQAPAFDQDSPPLTATVGQLYSYTFDATGSPSPSLALAPGAPSWLFLSPGNGMLTGTPPKGTRSFSYAVIASNDAGTVTAGPFTVAVATPPSRKADLRVALSCPATLTVAGAGNCVLTVTNAGPAAANRVAAQISLPAQLAETGCTGCTRNHRVYTWRLATLGPGGSVSYQLGVRGAHVGQAAVTGTASAASPDPQLANNQATAAVTVTKGAS